MAPATAAQESEHRCVQCDKATNLRCKGCDEGVDKYGVQVLTIYCSKECQITHRATHKSECKNANYRKQLYRTASVAKNIFFGVRKAVFMWNIQGAVKKDDVLHLTMDLPDGNADVIIDFPEGLFTNAEDRELAIAHRSDAASVMKMHRFIHSALEGACTAIHSIGVMIKPERQRVIPEGPSYTEDLQNCVLKVDLKDGSSYALDTCAVQYGLRQVVMPWDEYCSLLVSEVVYCFGDGMFGMAREKEEFLKQKDDVIGKPDAAYGQIAMLFQANVTRLMYCAINAWMTKLDKSAAEMVKQKRAPYTEDSKALQKFVADHMSNFATLLKSSGVAKITTSVQDPVGWYFGGARDIEGKIEVDKGEESQPGVSKEVQDFMWPEMEKAWREFDQAKEEEMPKVQMMEFGGENGIDIWGNK